MSKKKSHKVELSDKEFKLFSALQENPEMLEKLTGITDKFNKEVSNGMDAYEAECHIIQAIQDLGQSMMSNWAKKTQDEAVREATKSSDTIKHGKKNSTGIAPSEK